jgi:hypothetical protein
MKSAHWLLIVAVFLIGASAVAPAYAQDKGGYVGLSRGGSDDKALDDSDSGFKLLGGYRFNKYIALEGAIVNLAYALGPADLAKNGISVQGVATLPIGKRLELFAKAGFFAWDVTIEDTSSCYLYLGEVVCDARKVDDGIDPAYAVGAQILFAERWSVRFERERFVDVGDSNIDFRSLGVMYKF